MDKKELKTVILEKLLLMMEKDIVYMVKHRRNFLKKRLPKRYKGSR